MLSILRANGVINEYAQIMFIGASLVVKRNSKDKLESLNELYNLISNEMLYYIRLFENNAVIIINELLKYDEKDLVNEIKKMLEICYWFNIKTPETVAELIDYLLKVEDGADILDLYSGIGNIDEVLTKNHKNLSIDGFDINDGFVDFAKLKMYVLKKDNINYFKKDILTESIEKRYQYAVADVPFISRYDSEIKKIIDGECLNLQLKVTGRISITWITVIKILASLRFNGKAVVVTKKGTLFNTLDREIRKELVEMGYIEAIIDLPKKIVPYTSAELSLIVLNKSDRRNAIKFVDLKDCYLMKGKNNIIDLEKAKRTIQTESVKVDLKEIRDNNFSLNYNTYTGKVEIENGRKLGEVSWDIFRGYQITSSELNKMLVDNKEEMNYKILEISNINDDGKICSELKMINSGERNLDRYLLQNRDIVISARGDKVKICLLDIGYDENIIANGSINVIRADQNRLIPLYLKTFLDSEKGKISLNNIKSGVTIPSLNVGELQKMIVPCPSMEEQREILEKIEIKLELIKSTEKRLEELKRELKDMANLI